MHAFHHLGSYWRAECHEKKLQQKFQQQTHLLEKHITPRHFVNGRQRILHDSHDRSIGLRCHNHAWNSSELTDLRSSFQRLSQVQIHLVTIKVGVVRCCHTLKQHIQTHTASRAFPPKDNSSKI